MSKKNPIAIRQERYENVLNAIQESALWLDVETLSSLSGVSTGLCKPLLTQLIKEGLIGQRVRQSLSSTAGTTLYAKPSLVEDHLAQLEVTTEYRLAKSSFQLMPHSLNGGIPKNYIEKFSPQKSLAMLARRT